MEWKPFKCYEVTMYKHTGYLILNDKQAGIFGYKDEGDYMGKHYTKARFYEVYKPEKSPKLRFKRRKLGQYDLRLKTTFCNVGLHPELMPLLVEMMDKIYGEITGKPMITIASPEDEKRDKPVTAQQMAAKLGV